MKIIEKIIKLREKAANEAATEAEAMAAIQQAERLMRAYEISEVDLALAESGVREVNVVSREMAVNAYKKKRKNPWDRSHQHPVVYCGMLVGEATGTRIIGDYNVLGGLKIFGTPAAIEYAEYLLTIIRNALDGEYEKWKAEQVYVSRSSKPAFQMAMVSRINERLREMIARRREFEMSPQKLIEDRQDLTQQERDRFALVYKGYAAEVRKAVDDLVAKTYPRIVTGRHSSFQIRDNNAYSAGRAAGDRVHLGRGIGGNKKLAYHG
ncbi:MAG: DUF2786 domain-containing protein [Gammaproteobacteria bacterium]|nr:MAG: DUF2786 domain-containing protein [Gammaproteobacteria bacterium]